jgi:hypothetical protein
MMICKIEIFVFTKNSKIKRFTYSRRQCKWCTSGNIELPYLNGRSGTAVPDNKRNQCQAGSALTVEI